MNIINPVALSCYGTVSVLLSPLVLQRLQSIPVQQHPQPSIPLFLLQQRMPPTLSALPQLDSATCLNPTEQRLGDNLVLAVHRRGRPFQHALYDCRQIPPASCLAASIYQIALNGRSRNRKCLWRSSPEGGRG